MLRILVILIPILAFLGLILYFSSELTNLKYQNNVLKLEALRQSDTAKTCNPTITPVCPQVMGYEQLGACSKESCLFKGPEAVEGYGVAEGYYTTHQGVSIDNKTHTCDSLAVTKGNAMTDSMLDWVKNGNTVNAAQDGKLAMNLDLTSLPADQKSLITNSTASSPIELGVIRKTPQARDATPCESFVDIISVSKLN